MLILLTLNIRYLLNFSYLTVNGETKLNKWRLYLYKQNLFINHTELVSVFNSFIMKKTILTLSLTAMFLGTGLMANETTSNFEFASTTNIKGVEISSFCKAVMQGDIDMVKRMLELGEDVNQKSLGMTPAMFAARYNKAEVLQLLIAKGANLKIKSNQGFSVKKYAELSNATDALAVLETALGS